MNTISKFKVGDYIEIVNDKMKVLDIRTMTGSAPGIGDYDWIEYKINVTGGSDATSCVWIREDLLKHSNIVSCNDEKEPQLAKSYSKTRNGIEEPTINALLDRISSLESTVATLKDEKVSLGRIIQTILTNTINGLREIDISIKDIDGRVEKTEKDTEKISNTLNSEDTKNKARMSDIKTEIRLLKHTFVNGKEN